MISLADSRWTTINKIRIINSNVITNTSDSGEEVDRGICFFKEEQ